MMAQGKKATKTKVDVKNYAAVSFVETESQAKDSEALLASSNIPCIITEQKNHIGTHGYAVMVPEEYADEAYVVIESQDAYDDFYDFSMEDDDPDLDIDLFDEDF